MFRTSGHTPSGLELTGKADRDARDRIDLERDRLLARLDRERRHHRARDDDFSAAQPLAEGREHVGTWRTMPTHSPVLACGSLVRANSLARRMTRQVRPSDALPARAGPPPSSTTWR